MQTDVFTTWLTPKEAANYVRLKEDTLRHMRTNGNGPEFYRLSKNRILYQRDALDRWIKAGLSA